MRRRVRAGAVAILAGMAPAASCAANREAPQRGMIVQVSGTGEAGAPCTAEVEGRRIAMQDFAAFARQRRGREAHIRGDVNTPYRCIGGLILELQKAGLQRIGFISEPPPATDR